VSKKTGTSQKGFQEASGHLQELTGVSVSAKEEQMESEETGKEVGSQEDAQVEAFWSEEKDISAEVTARRFYITADGVMVRTGKDTHNEAKIGSVYETPLAREAIAGEGANAIIQLRILWKNGEWHKFWSNRKVAG
jgi:hypothetical protein